MSSDTEYEKGFIRTDRGLFLDKGNQVFNVCHPDFGAKGDNSTDDTLAIQATIDELPTDGGVVFMPAGIYLISSKLKVDGRGIQLCGAGEFATVILSQTDDITCVEVSSSFCRVHNLQIQVQGTTGIGISVTGAPGTQLRDLQLLSKTDGSNTGIMLRDNSAGGAYNHVIEQVKMNSGASAFGTAIDSINDAGGQIAVRVYGCHLIADIGINIIDGGGSWMIMGNLLQSNTGTTGTAVGQGIVSRGTSDMIIANYFERYVDAVKTFSTGSLPPQVGFNHLDNCDNYITLNSGAAQPVFVFDSEALKLGLFGMDPVVQVPAYTPTNIVTDRSYDANSTTLAEIADVLGTLITDLQSYGLVP